MILRRFALLCAALASVSMSGCAALGQFTDSVWSETRSLSQKTQKQIALILRPAPKQTYEFEETDAALNTALLETLAFEVRGPEVLIEDARTRFAAEVPTLRPLPTQLAEADYGLVDEDGEDNLDQLPIKTSYSRAYTKLDAITVEILDPIPALATDFVTTEIIPAADTGPEPAASSSIDDDFVLAGAPGSPELKL